MKFFVAGIGFCSRACLPAGQREGLLPLRRRDGEIKGRRSPCEGGQVDICRATPRNIVGHVLWSSRQEQAGSFPLCAQAPTLAPIVDQVPNSVVSLNPLSQEEDSYPRRRRKRIIVIKSNNPHLTNGELLI
jgi:hypothetical protein